MRRLVLDPLVLSYIIKPGLIVLAVPINGNRSLLLRDLHAVNGVLDVLGSPPGQGSGAETDTGEAQGGEYEACVAGQAYEILLVVRSFQLVSAF